MRLIDADKLKVYLQEYLHYGHAIPWVDAQPTAYDVEKVVAELEDNQMWKDYMIYELTHREYSILKKAIDIVKAERADKCDTK